MDASAELYDASDRLIGEIFSSGTVQDTSKHPVGEVHNAFGGEVWGPSGGGRFANLLGEATSTGNVIDYNDRVIGQVLGTTIYDNSGKRIGRVRAETRTMGATQITDAHRAGAALLLLFKKGNTL